MSARVFGGIGVVMGVGLAVVGALPSVAFASWGVALCVLLAVLSWIALVRPSMTLDEHQIVLRQMLEEVTVPLADVTDFSVRQVGRIKLSDGRVLTTAAVTRSRGQIFRDAGGPERLGRLERIAVRLGSGDSPGGRTRARSYGWHVEETVFGRLAALRESTGSPTATGPGDEQAQVVRRRAWPELVALVASAVVTVVLIAV